MMKLTNEQLLENMTSAVQLMLDKKAHEFGYDNMISLCSYSTSTHPKFGPEGRAGLAWRDAVWTKCNEILDAVIAGERPIPTREELLAELPMFEWPE